MKKLLTILAALSIVVCSADAKSRKAGNEAVFQTNIHCQHCATKIQENISFERGVKDLSIDVSAKTVRIVYNPEKTNPEKLAAAIRKLGYKVEVKSDRTL